MRAHQIMTRNVITVGSDVSIIEAAKLMLDNHISGLPVLDKGGKLTGIVSEGDFLRRSEIGTQRKRPRWLQYFIGPGRAADEFVHASGRKVEEVMTREPAGGHRGHDARRNRAADGEERASSACRSCATTSWSES